MFSNIKAKGREVALRLIGPLCFLVLALPTGASAAVDVRTVTSNQDPGDGSCATNGCTLREAINELNLDFDATDQDRIQIAFNSLVGSTITLGSTLTIADPLAITSTGVAPPKVSGNDAVRPFTIATSSGDDVSISGLTITDGLAPDSGGGVHSGGAINSSSADLFITGSAIRDSSAPGPYGLGGGISASGGQLTIVDSTISGNTARGFGGGGVFSSSNLWIRRSTISGNWTTPTSAGIGAEGGGIDTSGTALIENSTISGNHTEALLGHGGGAAFSGATTLIDSTVFGNYTQGTGGGDGADGGGLYNSRPENTNDTTLSNTIVAGNSVSGPESTGPDLEAASAADEFLVKYSLIGDSSSAPISHTAPGTNMLDQDPVLGPLAANGGPTLTHLPHPVSPVLDKGLANRPGDQRINNRPADFRNIPNGAGGDGADIGAVEIQIAPPLLAGTVPASPNGDDTPTIYGGAQDGTVRLYTDPSCTQPTGAPTTDDDFRTSGITADPVPHNATTTFYGTLETPYGTSLCSSSSPSQGSISYTHAAVQCLGSDVTISGTAGDDTLTGTTGADVIAGDAGNDKISGAGGNDKICGGVGSDALVGAGGSDTLSGAGGNDTFLEGARASGADAFSGGGGIDTANYGARSAAVAVSINNASDDGATGEADDVRTDVEILVGGSAGDTLTTSRSTLANELFGRNGNDTLNVVDGIGGNDAVDGGANTDRCTADSGDARLGCP